MISELPENQICRPDGYRDRRYNQHNLEESVHCLFARQIIHCHIVDPVEIMDIYIYEEAVGVKGTR